MKRIKYIAVLMMFMLGACSEFLYVEPEKQVSIDEQFSSREGMDMAITGMYGELEKLFSGKYFIYADLLGGNLAFSPDEKDKIVEIPLAKNIDQVYSFRDISSESDYATFYEDAYSLVNAANLIMENAAGKDYLDREQTDQITAECLSTRAVCHFLLTLLYAQNFNYTANASHPGIVYNTRSLIAGVDYPSRLTMAECYEHLKNDLDNALNLYTEAQAIDRGPDYSWFNEVTTRAMYARIALQMNDWTRAYDLADWVVNNSGITLTPGEDLVAEWEKPEEPVSEVILELTAPRDADDNTVTSSVGHEHYGFVDSSNYNDFVASEDLIALYDSIDIRKKLLIAKVLPTVTEGEESNKSYYFTAKFQDDPGTLLIRLSEMYLIRAEALARMGTNPAGALDDLNTIRKRAGLEELNNSDELLEEIFLERRRELAFEGHLFFDIARYKKDVIRGEDCLATTRNLSYPSDYFILPIPQSSTSLNENMEQNEGYY